MLPIIQSIPDRPNIDLRVSSVFGGNEPTDPSGGGRLMWKLSDHEEKEFTSGFRFVSDFKL